MCILWENLLIIIWYIYSFINRHAPSSRNENLLSNESILKASDENKHYYRGPENFQDGYSEDQSWNMQARR